MFRRQSADAYGIIGLVGKRAAGCGLAPAAGRRSVHAEGAPPYSFVAPVRLIASFASLMTSGGIA